MKKMEYPASPFELWALIKASCNSDAHLVSFTTEDIHNGDNWTAVIEYESELSLCLFFIDVGRYWSQWEHYCPGNMVKSK